MKHAKHRLQCFTEDHGEKNKKLKTIVILLEGVYLNKEFIAFEKSINSTCLKMKPMHWLVKCRS